MKKLSKTILEDLKKSGLNRKAALAMHIRDISADELREKFRAAYTKIGVQTPKKLPNIPAYEIPYFDLDGKPIGYCNYKLLGDYIAEGSKKPAKYLQLPGSSSHFYFPPFCNWSKIAHDTEQDIYIVEGEKKAAALTRLGFPTIALSGVWNWCSGGKSPISDFSLIDWKYRETIIVFDADV